MSNLLTQLPKAAQSAVATLVRSIFVQRDADLAEQNDERAIARRYMSSAPSPRFAR